MVDYMTVFLSICNSRLYNDLCIQELNIPSVISIANAASSSSCYRWLRYIQCRGTYLVRIIKHNKSTVNQRCLSVPTENNVKSGFQCIKLGHRNVQKQTKQYIFTMRRPTQRRTDNVTQRSKNATDK